MSVKLIYRAERHPQFDRHGFRDRWRRHAALGMSQPRWTNIRRYAHCDPVDDAAPWDGVALLWYRSEEARLRHVADAAARRIMRDDEAQTFVRPVREFSTLVEEIPLSEPARGAFKLFVFVWRDPGLTRAAFGRAWEHEHGRRRHDRLATLPGFRGLVLNRARDEVKLAGFGLDCDGIEESDWDTPLAVDDDRPALAARAEALWTRHVALSDADAHS